MEGATWSSPIQKPQCRRLNLLTCLISCFIWNHLEEDAGEVRNNMHTHCQLDTFVGSWFAVLRLERASMYKKCQFWRRTCSYFWNLVRERYSCFVNKPVLFIRRSAIVHFESSDRGSYHITLHLEWNTKWDGYLMLFSKLFSRDAIRSLYLGSIYDTKQNKNNRFSFVLCVLWLNRRSPACPRSR